MLSMKKRRVVLSRLRLRSSMNSLRPHENLVNLLHSRDDVGCPGLQRQLRRINNRTLVEVIRQNTWIQVWYKVGWLCFLLLTEFIMNASSETRRILAFENLVWNTVLIILLICWKWPTVITNYDKTYNGLSRSLLDFQLREHPDSIRELSRLVKQVLSFYVPFGDREQVILSQLCGHCI